MEALCAYNDSCTGSSRIRANSAVDGLGTYAWFGPTRARRLVEHFGTLTAVFRASLTELEASRLLVVSAQSLGTGKSFELAQEELGKGQAADVQIITLDDPAYPTQLRQI
jgi:predicted Rossmann fold nucleotide-binding protein DprA/Smf involved in DNA uptake